MRAKQIVIAFDQFINTLCNGWADETLSSRCWRWELNGKRSWPRKLIDAYSSGTRITAGKATKAS